MKKWKLITLISSGAVLIAAAITLTLIFTYKPKSEPDYQYPSVIPTILNKDETYVTIGSRNVTNEEVYNMAIVSYGLSTMLDLIDSKLFDLSLITEEEILDYKKELFASYNSISLDEVDLDDEEQTKTFIDQMTLQGFSSDEDIIDSIKLDLARQKYAKEVLASEINAYSPTIDMPTYFTESQVNQAISLFNDLVSKSKVVYISFRSRYEAIQLMQSLDINTNSLSNGWKKISTGEAFTKDEIVDTYLSIYNKVYSKEMTIDDVPEISSSELSEVSSTLSVYVFSKLSDILSSDNPTNCYITDPNKSYLASYYYLALRYDTTNKFTYEDFVRIYTDGTDDLEEKEIYNKVKEKLEENVLTSSYINYQLYKNRLDKNISIYDERLDLAYYNQSLQTLGAGYEMTTDESATIVCKAGDVKVNIDEFYNLLMKKYGAVISMQFMNFYMLFNESYSNVYNFETKTRLALFESSFCSNIEVLKESLEEGKYESYGYSRYYGWENFLRDYGGLTYIDDSVMLGDAYNLALAKYKNSKASTTNSLSDDLYEKFLSTYVQKDPSLRTTVEYFQSYLDEITDEATIDTIYYQVINNFQSFFSIKASSFTYYFDNNGDGLADEVDSETDHLGQTLFNAMFYIAKTGVTKLSEKENMSDDYKLAKEFLDEFNKGSYSSKVLKGETIDERLSSLVSIYNTSSLDDKVFSKYKLLGIRIVSGASSTYTSALTTGVVAEVFKDIWHQVSTGTLLLNDNKTYASFKHASQINATLQTLSAEGIDSSNPYILGEFVNDSNKKSIYIITEVTNFTWYQYYTKDGVTVESLLPASDRLQILLDYYIISLIDSTDRTVEEQKRFDSSTPTDWEAEFVTNVISQAYNNIVIDTSISKKMNEQRKAYINNGIALFKDSSLKELSLKILDLLYN